MLKKSMSLVCSINPIRHSKGLRSGLLALALGALSAGAAHAQAYVNLTVGGPMAPGVYGQISVGNNPAPPIINTAPVVIGQPVFGAAPMYLYVSTVEYRNWGRYCHRYQACGRPVYFVRVDDRDRWWERRGEGPHGPGRGFERHEERGHDRGEHRGWDRDGRGPGGDRGDRGEGHGERHGDRR